MPAMSQGRPAVSRMNSSQTAPRVVEVEAREAHRLGRSGRGSASRAGPSPGGVDELLGLKETIRSLLVLVHSFSPHCAAGQQDVGELRRLGRMVGVLDDDQLGLGQGAADLVQVGQADRGIGRRDPDRLELALLQGAEHLDGGQARPRRDRPRGRPQYASTSRAVLGVLDEAIAGQLLREQARLAAAHRVGLAGERERPRARLADLAGQQVQVDEAVVLPHADGALVQPHAVEAEQARARVRSGRPAPG